MGEGLREADKENLMYVDDLADTPHADIATFLEAHRSTAPHGAMGFKVIRGMTARKFVEVLLDVYENMDDFQRRFFEWLDKLAGEGMPKEYLNRELYTFHTAGKWTQET
jgi:hypothetical protein